MLSLEFIWDSNKWLCTNFLLQDLQTALSPSCSGDVILESPQLSQLALSLLTSAVPQSWLDLVGPSAPPSTWPLREWLQDLILRCSFLDRVLTGGLAKTATYWLGAFFNPAAFLSIIQQVSAELCDRETEVSLVIVGVFTCCLQNLVHILCARSGAAEQFVFHAEMTNRDKDHVSANASPLITAHSLCALAILSFIQRLVCFDKRHGAINFIIIVDS